MLPGRRCTGTASDGPGAGFIDELPGGSPLGIRRGVSHANAEAEARDPGIGKPANVGALLADGPRQPDPDGEDQLTAGQPGGWDLPGRWRAPKSAGTSALSRLTVTAAITPPIERHFGQRYRYEFDSLSMWLAIVPSLPSEPVNSMMPVACGPHS
jgi:hypothetical protein